MKIHETNSNKGTVVNMKNQTKKYRLVKTTTDIIEFEVNPTEFFEEVHAYYDDEAEETEEGLVTTLKNWFAEDVLDYDEEGKCGLKNIHTHYGTPMIEATELD